MLECAHPTTESAPASSDVHFESGKPHISNRREDKPEMRRLSTVSTGKLGMEYDVKKHQVTAPGNEVSEPLMLGSGASIGCAFRVASYP